MLMSIFFSFFPNLKKESGMLSIRLTNFELWERNSTSCYWSFVNIRKTPPEQATAKDRDVIKKRQS